MGDEEAKTMKLPDIPYDLLHHITSFMPTIDAVRMSVVSKQCIDMWYSYPKLDLCDVANRFGFVTECLKRREKDLLNGTITRVSFDLRSSEIYFSSQIDDFLKTLSNGKLKELDISIDKHYHLPDQVLGILSLTHLKLSRVFLLPGYMTRVNLPSLVSLTLECVSFGGDWSFHELLIGCCSLQRLTVDSCKGLKNPSIDSSLTRLNYLSIQTNKELQNFKIHAENIESFECHWSLTRLSSASRLRNLSLHQTAFMVDRVLEELILGLPCLESLTLDSCYGVLHYKIWSQTLTRLNLKIDNSESEIEPEITIEAPKLVYFKLQGTKTISNIWDRVSSSSPSIRKALLSSIRAE